MKKFVHVAVGVIFNSEELGNKILLAKRSDDQHQGGLWEFPGGKIEQGESVQVALKRELREELGMQCAVENMQPIIQIPFHYSDKSVLLDVWAVYDGILEKLSSCGSELLIGQEGQPLAWVERGDLSNYEFPAANKAIIDALLLPESIAITQDSDPEIVLSQVANIIKNNKRSWIQLRAPSLDRNQYTQLAMQLYGLCREANIKLIWNCPVGWYQVAFADGLHLSQKNLNTLTANERPIPKSQWLSCACHNLEEIEKAQERVDYALVSPVKQTTTHPQANVLTWNGFRELSNTAQIPCYALGGLNLADITIAQKNGGQGVAGISCFI